jgi:hypothetical protein
MGKLKGLQIESVESEEELTSIRSRLGLPTISWQTYKVLLARAR